MIKQARIMEQRVRGWQDKQDEAISNFLTEPQHTGEQ